MLMKAHLISSTQFVCHLNYHEFALYGLWDALQQKVQYSGSAIYDYKEQKYF